MMRIHIIGAYYTILWIRCRIFMRVHFCIFNYKMFMLGALSGCSLAHNGRAHGCDQTGVFSFNCRLNKPRQHRIYVFHHVVRGSCVETLCLWRETRGESHTRTNGLCVTPEWINVTNSKLCFKPSASLATFGFFF